MDAAYSLARPEHLPGFFFSAVRARAVSARAFTMTIAIIEKTVKLRSESKRNRSAIPAKESNCAGCTGRNCGARNQRSKQFPKFFGTIGTKVQLLGPRP